MRLLVLSSNNGAGHNSAGNALMEAARRQGIDCYMEDGLALASKTSAWALEEIHVQSARYAPQLFVWGNRVAQSMTQTGKPSPCYRAYARCAPKLMEYIRENRFDAVVTTHIFPALMLTAIKRTMDPGLPAFFVATDYSCAPFLCETELDGYFIPHEGLRQDFLNAGIPNEKLFATGIPVAAKLLAHADASAARAQLQLPQDCPLALIMTGSMGFGCVGEQIEALLTTLPQEAKVVLLAGNNKKLKSAVEQRFPEEPRLITRGYTHQVPLYLDACNVLLSKPGGLSATEAAVHGIPLVLTAPIPGCWEEDNLRFFAKYGLALPGPDPKLAAQQAARLLNRREERTEMLVNQHQQIQPMAAAPILQQIVAGERQSLSNLCLFPATPTPSRLAKGPLTRRPTAHGEPALQGDAAL